MQDERLREDAKQLLGIAYERQVASGEVGLGVDLQAAADEQGIGRAIRETLADFIWSAMQRKPMILPVVMEV